ncbi:MAG: Nif3-like dinuclear metal center hexameric protein [Candidatus Hodarchaeales archaeon]
MASEEDLRKLSLSCPLRSVTPSMSDIDQGIHLIILSRKLIHSDDVIEFLENRSPIYKFEYSHVKRKNSNLSLGYEIKSVNDINAIYLMINPDPKKFSLIPPNSLIISHHKISCYGNRIYQGMLDQAQKNQINIYNFHLAWDVMEGGIGDSFLHHLGLKPFEFEKVDLTYKKTTIHGLGAILKQKYTLEEITSLLEKVNVNPSIIYNKHCKHSKVGYIPGGGFEDTMIIEMADYGVDILISSDHNWTVETLVRELEMTLIDIDHYKSERYGLHTMRNILTNAFPDTPTIILDNMPSIQCSCPECYCHAPKTKNR